MLNIWEQSIVFFDDTMCDYWTLREQPIKFLTDILYEISSLMLLTQLKFGIDKPVYHSILHCSTRMKLSLLGRFSKPLKRVQKTDDYIYATDNE